jgi:transposase-like protein
LTTQILEAGLEVEVDGSSAVRSTSPRTRSTTVVTEIGLVDIDVPRDRDSSFEPQTVRKGRRRLDGGFLRAARGLR